MQQTPIRSNAGAVALVSELARQRRRKGALSLSFEVVDLREVIIDGPVDLVALASALAPVE